MFVEEKGTVTLAVGKVVLLQERTIGFYTYRSAKLVGVLSPAFGQTGVTSVQYKGGTDGDNHRLYLLERGGFLAVFDGKVQFGSDAEPC